MGFSVLELVIAMVMMAVLVGVGLPGLQQTAERVQMQALMHSWLLVLQQRKAQAMADKQRVTVSVEQLAQSLSMQSDTAPGWQLVHNYSAQSPLVFDGERGFARAGSLQLQGPQLSIKIIISGLGRIRSCQSAGVRLPGVSAC